MRRHRRARPLWRWGWGVSCCVCVWLVKCWRERRSCASRGRCDRRIVLRRSHEKPKLELYCAVNTEHCERGRHSRQLTWRIGTRKRAAEVALLLLLLHADYSTYHAGLLCCLLQANDLKAVHFASIDGLYPCRTSLRACRPGLAAVLVIPQAAGQAKTTRGSTPSGF